MGQWERARRRKRWEEEEEGRVNIKKKGDLIPKSLRKRNYTEIRIIEFDRHDNQRRPVENKGLKT